MIIYHLHKRNVTKKWKKSTMHKPEKQVIGVTPFTNSSVQQPVANNERSHSRNTLRSRKWQVTRYMVMANEEEITHSRTKPQHSHNLVVVNEDVNLHSCTQV